jgi:hypothetical protein
MPTVKPDIKCKNDKNYCMVFNLKCCDHKMTKCDNLKVAVYRCAERSSESSSTSNESSTSSYFSTHGTLINQVDMKDQQNQQQKSAATQPKSRIRSCTELVKKIRDMLDTYENNKSKTSSINVESNHANERNFQISGETGSNKSNYAERSYLSEDLDSVNRQEYNYVYDLYHGEKKISQNNSLSQIINDENIDKLHTSIHDDEQIQPGDSSLHSSRTGSTCLHNIFNSLSHKTSQQSQSLDMIDESINEDNLSRPSNLSSISRSIQIISQSRSPSERSSEANKTLTEYRKSQQDSLC